MRAFPNRVGFAALVAGGLAVACSSSSSGAGGGSGTASGNVSGTSLDVAATLAYETTEDGLQLLAVGLFNNAAATCSFLQSAAASSADVSYANLTGLAIEVAADGSVAPGTYDLSSATVPSAGKPIALSYFLSSNSTCASTEVQATGGTVTINAISSSSVSGSYNVTFGASGTLSGTFDSSICAAAPTASSASGSGSSATVCKQL